MADPTPRREDLARQARQHLASLQANGVEWLPNAPPPRRQPMAVKSPAPSIGDTSSSLFERTSAATDSDRPAPDQRRRELAVLVEEVRPCTLCPELAETRTQTVFGVGPIDADLCLIGEAPGADEDRQGEPFVGAAGQLLNRILAACGMTRADVYICNILKCRPPGNRTPRPDEAASCRGFLDRQLKLIGPKFIVCLGGTAAQNLLGTTASLGKLRGTFHDYHGIPVMCTYHPAYLLPHRSPDKKKDVWEDMKMLLQRMGKPIPAPGGSKG